MERWRLLRLGRVEMVVTNPGEEGGGLKQERGSIHRVTRIGEGIGYAINVDHASIHRRLKEGNKA